MVRTTPQPSPEMVTDSVFCRLEARFEQLSVEKTLIEKNAEEQCKQAEDLKKREEAVVQSEQERDAHEADLVHRESLLTIARANVEGRLEKVAKENEDLQKRMTEVKSSEEKLFKAQRDLADQISATKDAENNITERQIALNDHERALDSSNEEISIRLADVERRERAVQERESDVVAEEDRLEGMKQDNSTNRAAAREQARCNMDEETKYIEEVGVANYPHPDGESVDMTSANGYFGELHGCRATALTAKDGDHYKCDVQFPAALVGWHGHMRIPAYILPEHDIETFEQDGIVSFGSGPYSGQVLLRGLILEKCTPETVTRRVLLQGGVEEYEGECTFPRPEPQI